MEHLGNRAYGNHVKSMQNRRVGLFHRSQNDNSARSLQNKCYSAVCDCNCGMGIKVEDIDMVFHWDPSKNILAYWQEVGRCARDGR